MRSNILRRAKPKTFKKQQFDPFNDFPGVKMTNATPSAVLMHTDVSQDYGIFYEFSDKSRQPTLALGRYYKIETTPQKFLEELARAFTTQEQPTVRMDSWWGGSFFFKIYSKDGELVALSQVEVQPSDIKYTDTATLSLNVKLVGHSTYVLGIEPQLNKIESDALAQVTWAYRASRGHTQYAEVILPKPQPIKASFYPFLDKDPDLYFESFLKSESAVLILMGPPGTGKTSFLKHVLHKHKMNAMITYDQTLIEDDELYVSFMLGDRHDVFIIEDADLMLSAREGGDNKVMSKFLNVSDGLIKFPKKKLVFTTNLTDTGRIDEALMRPGRCFGIIKFRELSLPEAKVAAREAGLTLPTQPCTLAELWNGQVKAPEARKVGFQV